MIGLTLDAGALIAVERGNRRVTELLNQTLMSGESIAIPAGSLAQVWRASLAQHHLHKLLGDDRIEVVALDREEALLVGSLCAQVGVSDAVDVSVATCAARRDHAVVTTDPDDIVAIDPTLPLIVP